jgi:hypothetical protein
MDKFIKIPVGADTKLVRVSGVLKVVSTSTILTTITYLNGASAGLGHAAATGEENVVQVEALIEKALTKSWQVPVYDATGAADAFPQVITSIV